MFDVLCRCHGYLAVAADGVCGVVETPLFPPDSGEPDYLIVKTGGRIRPRYPVVSMALVTAVDPERELVLLSASKDELQRLPERLPLAT